MKPMYNVCRFCKHPESIFKKVLLDRDGNKVTLSSLFFFCENKACIHSFAITADTVIRPQFDNPFMWVRVPQ